MLTMIQAGALNGIDAFPVQVEVSVTTGTKYYIVGLPDASIRESFQRIDSALRNNHLRMPRQKIVVNLAPADIPKEGSAFDLSIAAGILACTEQWDFTDFKDYLIMGELSLNGDLKPIRGVLSLSILARKLGLRGIILPSSNAAEAGIVSDLEIIGVENIQDFRDLHSKRIALSSRSVSALVLPSQDYYPLDFKEVNGQRDIKRALEIACAGGHNILMIGPPGSGKSMLAKRVPGILPPMNLFEAIQTTQIHSVKGLGNCPSLMNTRPFRAPHHSISDIALVGGGKDLQPGEISLAHNGVLFLDELPEFKRSALEVLRQPMEMHSIQISRARSSVEYPSGFMLIGAMNPCPCGNFNHPEKECTCGPGIVSKYLNRVSGPLLDRVDIQIQVTPVSIQDIQGNTSAESSVSIQNRVIRARELQVQRMISLEGTNSPFDRHISQVYPNARINKKWVPSICQLDSPSKILIKKAMESLKLSARAYDHILKISRTLADLEGKEGIEKVHIAEAIQYRSLDRNSWG